MHPLRVAALAAAIGLVASAARAADYSRSLTAGTVPVAVTMLPAASGGRTSLMIVSADAAGAPSGWCTFRANTTPGPGVPGSFEIVAGAPGFDRQLPANIPQAPLVCAPLPNSTTDLTIEANQ